MVDVPPVFDRRAGDEGEEDAQHQELFAEGQREHGQALSERSGERKFFGGTMNSAAVLSCQTSVRGKFAAGLAVAAALLWNVPAPGTDTLPPDWQNELNALRLSDAAIVLLPPARAAGAADTDRRLDELFRGLAAHYPGEAAVRKAAGDHFWRRDDPETAVAEWEAAQTLDPTDAETASALGNARLRNGQTREACGQFRRAVAARPEVARYHFELANVLYLFRHQLTGLPGLPDERTTAREALAQLRLARDLAAGNVEFARAYAETFYGVPDPDWPEALDAWEHVRALSADAPDFALGHLARVSLKLGRPDEARKYLDMIHDPRFTDLQAKLRQQLQTLGRDGSPSGP